MFLMILKKLCRIMLFLIKWLCFLFIVLFLISLIYDFFILYKYSFQINFYIALNLILLVYTFLVFIKTKRLNFIIYIVLWVMLILSSKVLPDVIAINDNLMCIDNSVCKEGEIIKTAQVEFIINRENCNKFNYYWNEKNKTCDLRKNIK